MTGSQKQPSTVSQRWRGRTLWDKCVCLVALALVAALILSLLPLYQAAQYSYPGVDDYRYGRTTHQVWQETGSLFETVGEAARVAGETYHSWQGSLSAIFLMALEPGVFGHQFYGISTYFLLTALVLCLLYFVYVLCRKVFSMEGQEALALAALGSICCIQFVPEPVESYYWFNGGVYYTFYFGLSLWAAGLLISRRAKKRPVQVVVLPLLAALIGTGNLVTGLLSCIGMTGYVVWSWGVKKQRDSLTLASGLLLLIAFGVNALAPGNGVRQAENLDRAQAAIPAIFAALGDGAQYAYKWMGSCAPWGLLLGVPLIWNWAGKGSFRFRWPLMITLGSFLLFSAGFAPNEYALSFPGEARVMDVQFYLFTVLLLVNLIWYVGWLRQHWKPVAKLARWAAVAVVAIGVLLLGVTAVTSRNVAAVSAYRVCRNGDGQAYAALWEQRLAMLEDPAQDLVILPKFDHQPPLLCMVDIAVDEDGEYYFYNEQLAAYFGKAQVLREP